MASERVRDPWWAAVFASGAIAAVLVSVAVLVGGGRPPVSAAHAQQPGVATASGEQRSVAFIGDSWTAGAGATAHRGYAVLTAEQLGWRSTLLGVGGSGYLVRGHGSVYSDRIERAVASDPDVIVVQGSLNERASKVAGLASAALDTLTRLQAAADPGTTIIVLGASYNPGTDPAVIDRINGAVSAAARTEGLRFVDVAAEDWTDPADPSVWADSIHPNDLGHQLIADHLETILEHVDRS
jgi:lysophospholipase L1-like esterase